MTPRVLNKRLDKIPPDAIYVGRPSKWGNPYCFGSEKVPGFIRYTREEVIELYRQYLNCHPKLMDMAKKELKGKDLVCWCAPLPCHADVLLELANREAKHGES